MVGRRRRRRLLAPAVLRRVSGAIVDAPAGSPLKLLMPLRERLRSQMTAADVLEILDALAEANVTCWLAGGWGVDALLGRQTRRHADVDLVVLDFASSIDPSCRALGELGYARVVDKEGGVWMPERRGIEDGAGGRVEVLGIDWQRWSAAFPESEDRRAAFASGTIGGRSVPCLSLATQVLFHRDFAVRRPLDRDIRTLEQLIAPTPLPPQPSV